MTSLEWVLKPPQPDNWKGKEHCLEVNKIFKFKFTIESYTKLNISYELLKPNIEKQTEYKFCAKLILSIPIT